MAAPGLYIDTLNSIDGCDSIRRLNLNVWPVTKDTLTATICEGQTIGGYGLSGVYTDTLQSLLTGCDSLFTIDLTVIATFDTTLNVAICNGDSYRGLHIPGTYIDSLSTMLGCDSVVTINLSLLPPIQTQSVHNICPGDSIAGYWQSGTFIDTFSTASGCDSIHTRFIQVLPNKDTTIHASLCPGDSIFGYSQAGFFVDTLTSTYGCDSVRQLVISMLDTYDTTMNVTICNGESFAGYQSSGTYIDVLQAQNGCDSTRTLNLSVYTINTAVTVSNFTLFANNSAALSYQWIDCTLMKPIAGANSLSYKPPKNGEYAVIIDQGGCTDTSECVKVRGINNPEIRLPELKVYPNPTDGEFIIELPSVTEQFEVRIIDAFGKRVYQEMFTGTREAVIDLDQPKGVYFVEIEIGGATKILKLIRN